MMRVRGHAQHARLTQPDGTVWSGFSGSEIGCGFEDTLHDHRLANTSRMFLHAHGGWREVPITAKMDM